MPKNTKGAAAAAAPRKPKTDRKACTVKDVEPHKFIRAYAEQLKAQGRVQVPEWAEYIKTAPSRELAPQDPDWFYTRLAAVARRVYIRPGCGIAGLRKVFGQANYQKHVVTSHTSLASGGCIRHSLRILGELGVVEPVADGSGRQIAAAGRREMDLVAQALIMEQSAH